MEEANDLLDKATMHGDWAMEADPTYSNEITMTEGKKQYEVVLVSSKLEKKFIALYSKLMFREHKRQHPCGLFREIYFNILEYFYNCLNGVF